MKQILTDYLIICSRFRNEGLSKSERRQRHTLLTEWAKNKYADGCPTLPELYNFWDKHSDICYNKVFIEKAINPAIDVDMENGGIEGLKFLFYCLREKDDVSYVASNSPVSIFCATKEYNFTPFRLADIILEREPDNEDALRYKYHRLKYFLEFSLHELPFGILNGMNGASLSDIPSMLNDIDEFGRVAKKINMPLCESLIEDCHKYYIAYKDYLQNLDQYKDFEDYLDLRGISY